MMSCKKACRHERNGVRQSCYQQVAGGRGVRKRGVCTEKTVPQAGEFECPNKQKMWLAD